MFMRNPGLMVLSAGMIVMSQGPLAAAPLKGGAAANRVEEGVRSQDPYLGMIALDAASGRTLFEESADQLGYPASVIKMMNLLLVLEAVRQGIIKLSDQVSVTSEAARTGGSQVYLKQGEQFTVEDLLYALMVQSANDAATALAIHLAGSKASFVERMNAKARELGMVNTQFHSVHGLPPAAGQSFDQSTARDLAILARALLKYPEALQYSSTLVRPFRDGKFIMRNHNKLLGQVEGVDGLKTGYIRAGGFSIAVTGQRASQRVVVVVFGSRDRKVRDRKATELYRKALDQLTATTPRPLPTSGTALASGAIAATTQPAPVPPAALPATPGTAAATGASVPPPVDLEPPPPAGWFPVREMIWGAGGLMVGLLLGYALFGRRRRML